MRIEVAQFVELPEVCICFPLFETINVTRLRINYPNLELKMGEKEFSYELGLLKVGELYDVIKNHQKIIQKVHPAYYVDDYYRIKLTSDNCNTKYKFYEKNFCTVVRCSLSNVNNVFYNRSVLVKGESQGKLLTIEFGADLKNFSRRFRIHLIPQNGLLWSGREAPIHYEINQNYPSFVLTLTYHVIRNKYQRNDFFINYCKDYTKQGFRCRLEKEKKCLDEISYKAIGAPYSNGLQTIGYDVLTMRTGLYLNYLQYNFKLRNQTKAKKLEKIIGRKSCCDSKLSTQTLNQMFDKFQNICEEKIPDCEETLLIPHIENVRYRQTESSVIVLNVSGLFDYLNVYQPIFGWENILLYIQSCIGFWVGISPMSIIDWFDRRKTIKKQMIKPREGVKNCCRQ